jgi:putative transposase
MSIVFDLERTNQLSLLPDKDLVDLCPPIEPYQVTKNRILQRFSSKILGLKPRRSTTALLLNIRTFTKYMLKCETWKKPIRFDFTQHQNKSRYCGAHWAV